jgi:hypothetical protein
MNNKTIKKEKNWIEHASDMVGSRGLNQSNRKKKKVFPSENRSEMMMV